MATVSTLVSLFGVSKHTIRTWTREFAEFLSSGATPPLGQRRRYDDDDIAVFAMINHLRGQNAKFEEIKSVLRRGDRIEVPLDAMDMAVSGQSAAHSAGPASTVGYAPVELIESFAQRLTIQFQDQINQLRDQIDRLDQQNSYFRDKFEETLVELRTEQTKVLEAEKQIARLETELKSADKNEQMLKEERSARMNAQNRLAAAQAKAERLEATMESKQEQKGRSGGFFGRRRR